MSPLPPYIHHFSWNTKISIELPLGFEEAAEDEENNSAIYADDLDEDDELGARVLTKATAVPEAEDAAYRLLAGESAGLPGRRTQTRRDCTIDGAAAVQQVHLYHEDELEIDVMRHETFAQLGNVVFTITCLAPAARADEYLPAFEHAANTARFILL